MTKATPEKEIKAFLFDKDGTLQDTEKIFQIAWRQAAETFHVPDIDSTVYACTGMTLPTIAEYWEKKYPDIPFWPFITARNQHFEDMISKTVPVREGAIELLETLRAAGYRLALATSTGEKAAMDHLRRSGMDHLFDAMIFGDMVAYGKPAPDIYLAAAAALGVSPEVCVGVEDSVNGVLSICNAGMRALMVPDLIQPTPALEEKLWARCDRLLDILPLLAQRGYRV